MTKEEYEDFVLRYKGCGACFPLYLNLNYFEKKWFSAIQKDVAELEAQIEKMKCDVKTNIKWADQNKNEQMYCKLNAMINQWEIKEK
jgi:hypothetical protein